MHKFYAIFMKKLNEHDTRHLSPWRKEKGATAVKRKWCHGNIPVPVTHGGTGAKGSERERVMQDDGVIPASGFPQVSGMETSDNSDTVQMAHLIQHMHSVHGGRLGGYTFEACIFRADQVRRRK